MNRFNITNFLSIVIAMGIPTIIIGLVYVTVQQNYRTTANDPQIQIANEINAQLMRGKTVEAVMPENNIDIATSLAPFIVMYNIEGKPLRSSGYLEGKMPALPARIFDFVKMHVEDRITWLPNFRVRIAMVIIRSQTPTVAFVAAGGSLNEVEKREAALGRMVFIGWLLSMLLILMGKGLELFLQVKPRIP